MILILQVAKVEVVTSPWKATLTKSVSVESDSFSNNSNSSVSNNGVNSEIKATLNDELSQAQRSNTVEDINKGSVFISSNTNQSIHTSESNKKEMVITLDLLNILIFYIDCRMTLLECFGIHYNVYPT